MNSLSQDNRRCKVAIVGGGLIATVKYLPYIARQFRDRAQLCALCDRDETALTRARSSFGIPHTYTDLSSMLQEESPDMVVVCTPPATHAPIVVQALTASANVLVEKPMALTAADCQKMIDAASASGKKLGVMHNQVFNPAFQKAMHLVDQGKVGRFLGMRILLMTSVYDMTNDEAHWAHKLPGGMVGETGPHAVYLSLAFLDNVNQVDVRGKKHLPQYPWSVGEDIRFDLVGDNGISSATLVYGSDQTAAEVDIIGTHGCLKVDLQARIVTSLDRLQPNKAIPAKSLARSVLGGAWQTTASFLSNSLRYTLSKKLDGHYIGLRSFLDYVQHDALFPAEGHKGKQVQEVMAMLVASLPPAFEPVTAAAMEEQKRAS